MTRLLVLLGLVVLSTAGWIGSSFEDVPPAVEATEELPLYPSGHLLELLTLGQPTFLASVAWLEAIQYYGKHRLSDHRYPHAQHLFEVITSLDPDFETAYLFGALVLEDETGGLEAPRALLSRGMQRHPESWMLAFHRGFLEYLRGDRAIGGLDMATAARIPGAPPYVARLAAHACGTTGSLALAIRIWGEIAQQTEDEAIRALATERLAALRQQLLEKAQEAS